MGYRLMQRRKLPSILRNSRGKRFVSKNAARYADVRYPRRSEGGQPVAQSYDLLFDLWSGFERMAIGSAAGFLQAGRTVLLITSPPLTNAQRAGGKEPRGGLDAALPDGLHRSQTIMARRF
jgi:hypothetical protein